MKNFTDTLLGEELVLKDYMAKMRVTDRQMKPQELAFTDTKERINWIEEIEANQFENPLAVELAVLMQLGETWDPRKYDFEVVSITEKAIQVPRLILPE